MRSSALAGVAPGNLDEADGDGDEAIDRPLLVIDHEAAFATEGVHRRGEGAVYGLAGPDSAAQNEEQAPQSTAPPADPDRRMTTPAQPTPAYSAGAYTTPLDGRVAASIDAWKRPM